MKRFPLKALAATGLMMALSLPVYAAKTWKINLKDADISALVSEVSEITGKNFIVDSRVKGTITVISAKPLKSDEVYELFLGVLNVNGFAAVPSGSSIKLVPDVTAKQNGVKVDLTGNARGEELVTRVIPLDNTNAVDLVPVLRPMLPQFAHLAAVPSANALVVSDHANNIHALEEIIQGLDTTDNDGVESVGLKETRVDDVLSMLDGLAGGGASSSIPGGSSSKDAKTISRVRVVGDSRNNRLLLKGDPRSRKRVREIIASLDTAPGPQFSGVRVFRLRNASAKQVADVLKGIVLGANSSGSSSSSSSSSFNTMSSSSSTTGGTSGSTSTAPSTTSVSANGVSLVADDAMNALVVKADPALMKEIGNVITQLDQRRNQVLIQAAIVEISGDDVNQLGVQWAAGNPTSGVGIVNFSNISSISSLAIAASQKDPTLATISDGATFALGKGKVTYDANGNRTGFSFYGALIQALNSVTNANLLSTPSIMTLDNQEAKIVVGQNVPFITGSTATTSGGTTNPFTTIERQDVGITLKVVPHIGDGGTIRLEIEQEVSSVVPSTVKTADIVTNKRSIKTTVLADNAQTIALGGLIQDDSTKSTFKVPLLGDIPLLGYLFRSTSTQKTKRNLLVFLQPTILHDSDSTAALSRRQYDAVRVLQLNVSATGDVTRLPENVEEVYQGYAPKEQSKETAPAKKP